MRTFVWCLGRILETLLAVGLLGLIVALISAALGFRTICAFASIVAFGGLGPGYLILIVFGPLGLLKEEDW